VFGHAPLLKNRLLQIWEKQTVFSRCCCTENLPYPGLLGQRIYADSIRLGIRLGIMLGICNYKPV
jgi:hypothetical protein